MGWGRGQVWKIRSIRLQANLGKYGKIKSHNYLRGYLMATGVNPFIIATNSLAGSSRPDGAGGLRSLVARFTMDAIVTN
ncbi:MAG: hypothetical protein M5U34_47780, partial [Chloroflexi bacterium]|nr:hypothetical protein [Chloroflexota bacterium]